MEIEGEAFEAHEDSDDEEEFRNKGEGGTQLLQRHVASRRVTSSLSWSRRAQLITASLLFPSLVCRIGWTLLADSCPVCLTPLVRNRQKQVFCVSCAQWLLTEEQLALKLEAQHVNDSSAPPEPPASAPTTSHMRVASVRDDVPSSDERSPKRQASIELLSGASFNTIADTGMTASPAHPEVSTLPEALSSVNPPVVLSNLVSTLFQKLEEIRQAIAACKEIRDLTQLLSALGECIQAIQRAESLSQYGYPRPRR